MKFLRFSLTFWTDHWTHTVVTKHKVVALGLNLDKLGHQTFLPSQEKKKKKKEKSLSQLVLFLLPLYFHMLKIQAHFTKKHKLQALENIILCA